MADISTEELSQLNPGFKRRATDPTGPHELLIPQSKSQQFRDKLLQLPLEKRLNLTDYKVRSGDTLIALAKQFNTTVAQIKHTNKLKSHRIRVGQPLMILSSGLNGSMYTENQNQTDIKQSKRNSASSVKAQQYYRVKPGDSLWKIARQHQVRVKQLVNWNDIDSDSALSVGKRLQVSSKPIQERQTVQKVGYKVRSGDSLYRIADKFSVRVSDIVQWNNIKKDRYLQTGQHLTLYIDTTQKKQRDS